MMRRFVLPVLLVLTLCARAVSAATPAQYDRALGLVQRMVIYEAQSATAAARGEPFLAEGVYSLTDAVHALAAIHTVERPGEGVFLIDNRPLLQAITAAGRLRDRKKQAEAYAAIGQQITTLRRSLAPAPAGDPNPAGAESSVRMLLAGNEFASDPFPPPSPLERFTSWLDRIFSRWRLPTPHGPTPSIKPQVPKWILIFLGVAAFAVLVAVIVQALGRRTPRPRPLALNEEEEALVEARDTDSLLALADQQARGGDFRRAFRLVYVATLVALDTGGILRFDRSRTNWEYLRALRAAGRDDLYRAMTPLTHEFDRIWYGFAPAGAAEYAHAVAQYQALKDTPPVTQAVALGAA